MAQGRVSRALASLGRQEKNSIPAIEIFGGIFALLLVLFLIVNMMAASALQERMEQTSDEGLYRINWQNGSTGYVVMVFPDSLRIVETGETLAFADICRPASAFVRYATEVYNAKDSQLIFAIMERSIPPMRRARDCVQQLMPQRRIAIGWIIASNELLKSMRLEDMPAHIGEVLEGS